MVNTLTTERKMQLDITLFDKTREGVIDQANYLCKRMWMTHKSSVVGVGKCFNHGEEGYTAIFKLTALKHAEQ